MLDPFRLSFSLILSMVILTVVPECSLVLSLSPLELAFKLLSKNSYVSLVDIYLASDSAFAVSTPWYVCEIAHPKWKELIIEFYNMRRYIGSIIACLMCKLSQSLKFWSHSDMTRLWKCILEIKLEHSAFPFGFNLLHLSRIKGSCDKFSWVQKVFL